jgi:hypothetical protein
MAGWVAKGANFVLSMEDSAMFRQGASDALARMRATLRAARRAAPKAKRRKTKGR